VSSAEQYLDALVELAVGFGAKVAPGQVVVTSVEPGKEAFARAVATAAYRRGAKYVDVGYFDPHVKHARLQHADRDSLTYLPPWIGGRVLAAGEAHAALIEFYGDTEPDLMLDVDPELLGLDITPRVAEASTVINQRQCNWTILPAVTPAWAAAVYPDLPTEQAVAALWDMVAHLCRLTEPDPVAAWEARFDELKRVSATLNGLALDAVRFTGPGTDLTVGLLPGSRWQCAEMETEWGQIHHPNLPSEEVFTTPDPERTQGFVTATRPLLVPGAATVKGLKVHFEAGRAVRFEAESGAAVLESMTARDDGAARLGEVALVDRESRVGQSGLVFSNILLDENAASHIALGNGYDMTLADDASKARMNLSSIHVDFMIGSEEVNVTGITAAGEERPLLRDGVWQV
jgi:aminopeptidase